MDGTLANHTAIYLPRLCYDNAITDSFLSLDLLVYTTTPDITPCFEFVVLTWAPATMLLLLCVFSLLYHRQVATLHSVSATSPLDVAKKFMLSLLFVLNITEMILVATDDGLRLRELELWSALVRGIATLLALSYSSWAFRKGFHTSVVLLSYWLLLCVCDGMRVTSHALAHIDKVQLHYTSQSLQNLLYVQFAAELVLLLLQIPADEYALAGHARHGAPTEKSSLISKGKKYVAFSESDCPEIRAGFLNRLFVGWFSGLVYLGFRNPLTMAEVWAIRPEDSCKFIEEKFHKYWHNKISSCRRCCGPSVTLAWAIFRTCQATMVAGIFLLLIQSILDLINPLLLSTLIQFIGEGGPYDWHGYTIATAMLLNSLLSLFLNQQGTYLCYMTGMHIRTSLTTAIYNKALRLGTTSMKVGQITNLMAVDAYKLQDTFRLLPNVIVAPIMVAVATYTLWSRLGGAVLAGILWFAIIVPFVSIFSGKLIRGYQVQQMRLKDSRIKLTNQVLNGIKVLKFYAWEPAFEKRITTIRDNEIKLLKRVGLLFALNQATLFSSGFIAALLTFGLYIFNQGHGTLPVDVAFTTISLLNALQFPLFMLPSGIINTVQSAVSIQRLSKYLLTDEIDMEQVTHLPGQGQAVTMQDGCLSWDGELLSLKNINLRIPTGQLVAIVGPVGSGKSSMISSMLGEMKLTQGSINVDGSIAYVPQQAWTQNLTLRDNILFDKPYDVVKYEAVITACCLKEDLKILIGGDNIEIGERGLNMSGGQNQRVSLARACYQDNDIYLMDDPLSAVDAHVGKAIFQDVIGSTGLLKTKTRVLVTNSLTYVDKADLIVVLDNGRIAECGTYPELMANDDVFAGLIKDHMSNAAEENEDQKAEVEKGKIGLDKMEMQIIKPEADLKLDEREGRKLIKEELAQTGGIQCAVLKKFAHAASLTLMSCVLVGLVLAVIGNVGANIWLSVWASDPPNYYDRYHGIDDNPNLAYVGLGIYALIGLIFMSGVFMIAFGGVLAIIRASRTLHAALLANMLKNPMSFFDTTPKGRIVNRFSKDIDTLDDQLRTFVLMLLFQLSAMIATIVAICYSTPLFIVVAVVLALLFLGLQRLYITIARQLKRLESIQRSPVYANFSETLVGITSIRAYQQQARFTERANYLLDENQRAYYLVVTANRWLSTYSGMLACCVVYFVALYAVISRHTVDPGIVGLALTYALQFNTQAMTILRTACEVENNIVSVERLTEYIALPTEAPHEDPDHAPSLWWPEKGSVEFHDLCMRYRPDLDLVLKGVTCTIQSGEKVGIVGRTGAGKSSMTLALFRIVEAASGSIIIDGLDIAQMGLHDVRSNLAIIPQEPVVFSGNMRENLDPYGRHMDDDIWRALEQAHLRAFIAGREQGLLFECGEDGKNMSVGQRQLLCLARALLRKPRILVLDEATAAIDLHTDDLIQGTIRREFQDTTILTIAHRLNTIMDYDRILVMDQGKVAEFDSPSSLLKDNNTIFYSMAKNAGLV